MKVAENTVVVIDYTLKDNDGEMIDSSEGAGPLAFLHGAGNIIPGLEEALLGKEGRAMKCWLALNQKTRMVNV